MEIRIDAEDHTARRPPDRGGPAGTERNGHLPDGHPGQRRARPAPARYSRFVGMMKIALPSAAAALLGLVVIWPKVAPRDSVFRHAFANFNIKAIDTQSMQNPHYYGTDNQNVPFSVTANYATQVDVQNNVLSLDVPVADFTRKDGTGVILNADSGLFRQKDEILDLLGHVDLYMDNGFEMHSNSARLFVKTGDAAGDDPVHAQNPGGVIDGEGFRMQDRGHAISFTGHCVAVLDLAGSGRSAAKKPKSPRQAVKTGKDHS